MKLAGWGVVGHFIHLGRYNRIYVWGAPDGPTGMIGPQPVNLKRTTAVIFVCGLQVDRRIMADLPSIFSPLQ